VSVERIQGLADQAATALAQTGRTNVDVLVGDASRGLADQAPYNVIISAAASAEVPAAWVTQLAPGGRLLHPIAGMGLRLVRKDRSGNVTTDDHPGYVFVPLVSG
jgi:protein-L-isoaspartate(D-aspartate) O-methyltransferase